MLRSGRLTLKFREPVIPTRQAIVCVLEGDLTMGKESALLREEIRRQMDAGHNRVLLQMEKLNFMDSLGLGVLVELKAHAVNRCGDLRLCLCPSLVVRILFRLSLHKILEAYETEELALESWK